MSFLHVSESKKDGNCALLPPFLPKDHQSRPPPEIISMDGRERRDGKKRVGSQQAGSECTLSCPRLQAALIGESGSQALGEALVVNKSLATLE